MKKLFFVAVFALVANVAAAQDAFKQDVIKYLDMSGQAKTFEMLTQDIVKNIPAEKQADFKKELNASIKDLMGKIAEIYMKEFTHEDIKAAIKFYESPVGKKFNSKSSVLYQQSQAVGQEWGMGLQQLMMKYMQ
ncbi:hypothetical protein CHU92_04725 [Flavobacterium cyanobacteriorum]|uniref:DUF2059 domain-containing protein n=1 Tax=Flavobacterium cyanobacteriorum TaxID=2022802 RepID=A0A255ZDL6_9FLAO|nr:DUF2059 domain-containing protein [Flavobacterium cyanobacteriorum]OYQ39549.1 hypothetical protein CHU92_04725 [Flavobacterium cyanobacteriorum]